MECIVTGSLLLFCNQTMKKVLERAVLKLPFQDGEPVQRAILGGALEWKGTLRVPPQPGCPRVCPPWDYRSYATVQCYSVAMPLRCNIALEWQLQRFAAVAITAHTYWSTPVTSIKCAAADDWLTLPGSERHGTVEVELQSTAVTIKFCQASKRRCTAIDTTLTELCGRPIHRINIF